MSDQEGAWVDYWMEGGKAHLETVALIAAVRHVAIENESSCDVCAHILTMVPRDVPGFVAALERTGPILDHDRITVDGVWSFPRRDFLWHESRHRD